VAAEEWHPQQKTRFEADGSYVMEIPYSADTELLMDILRHVPEVQVVKPEALRQRLMATLEAGLATIRDSSNSG
jgi:predicted DNA-binding transcriptional regulator YafY